MNVKNAVLRRLEDNRGRYISGESVAAELGVSRQAVSKAVAALKGEGYAVTAVNNRGYMLDSGCDMLSSDIISSRTGARCLSYESIPSTNDVAAAEFALHGECIVVSRTQTGGKRKDGGSFYSPQDKGIYLSIALPLAIGVDKIGLLRETCAEATAEVITAACGKNTQRVRCDDIYIDGKKVCGLLIECAVNAATLTVGSAVIGIGIYTFETCFSDSALGSVFPDDTRNDMISEIYLKIKAKLKTAFG